MPQGIDEGVAVPASRAGQYVLCTAIVAGAVVYSTHLTSFLHAKEALYAATAGVLGALLLRNARIPKGALWLVGPFTATLMWGVFLGLFGVVPFGPSNLVECLRWVTLLLLVLCAYPVMGSEEGRLAVHRAVVYSAAIAGLLAMFQYGRFLPYFFPDYGGTAQRVYSVFGNAGLLGGYLAAAFPLALHETLKPRGKGRIALVLLAIIAGALMLSGARSAWIAAAIGTAFILISAKPTIGRLAVIGFAAFALETLLCLAAPQETVERLLSMFRSGDHGRSLREWFWLGTLRMIEDAPLTGVGLGNYRAFSARYLGDILWEPGGERLVHNLLHTDHAHCDALELMAELGVVGLIPLALWWGGLLRCRGPEWGGLLSLAVFSLAYYPFYSAPHALLGLLLAACLLGRRLGSREGDPAARSSRIVSIAAGTGAILVLPLVLWMVAIPSYQLRAAESLHLKGEDSTAAYERVLASRFAPPETHEMYGLALLEAGRAEDARNAFLTACSETDSGGAYLGLAASLFLDGDSAGAKDTIMQCLRRWPSSYEAWALLLNASPSHERADVVSRARPWLTPDEVTRLGQAAARGQAAPAATP